jgi:hypothetical protein
MAKVSQWTDAPLVRGNRKSVCSSPRELHELGTESVEMNPSVPSINPCRKAQLENVTAGRPRLRIRNSRYALRLT